MSAFDEVREVVNRSKGLGTRTLPDGTELIGHVPHIAREAYLHLMFAPLGDADIDELERRLGRFVAPAFRDFLKLTNGLSLFSGTAYIYGLRRTFERTGDAVWQPFSIETPNTIERPKSARSGFLFVGGYRVDGSKLVIDADTNKVHRCTRLTAEILNEWPDFWQMLVSETNRLSALFDEHGRRRDAQQATTP